MPKEIAILKTGRYTDANGRTYDITPAVLEDIARNTSPNSAPLVKGHPSSEAPSMGWVQGLKVAGDKLLAVFGKIDPAFAEEVKTEAFRNVSASFFQPYAPSNPKQGHYVLRHVGALGAARPAIVEEGSNANGSYVLYAGGQGTLKIVGGNISIGTNKTLTLPIVLAKDDYVVVLTTESTGGFLWVYPQTTSNFRVGLTGGALSIVRAAILGEW